MQASSSMHLTILSSEGDGLSTFLSQICKEGDKTRLVVPDKRGDSNGGFTYNLHTNTFEAVSKSIGTIFLFDTTSQASYDQAISRISTVAGLIEDKQLKMQFLIGTKIDLSDQRQIQYQDGNKYGITNGLNYMEISSYTREGIEYFLNILKNRSALLLKKLQKRSSQSSETTLGQQSARNNHAVESQPTTPVSFMNIQPNFPTKQPESEESSPQGHPNSQVNKLNIDSLIEFMKQSTLLSDRSTSSNKNNSNTNNNNNNTTNNLSNNNTNNSNKRLLKEEIEEEFEESKSENSSIQSNTISMMSQKQGTPMIPHLFLPQSQHSPLTQLLQNRQKASSDQVKEEKVGSSTDPVPGVVEPVIRKQQSGYSSSFDSEEDESCDSIQVTKSPLKVEKAWPREQDQDQISAKGSVQGDMKSTRQLSAEGYSIYITNASVDKRQQPKRRVSMMTPLVSRPQMTFAQRRLSYKEVNTIPIPEINYGRIHLRDKNTATIPLPSILRNADAIEGRVERTEISSAISSANASSRPSSSYNVAEFNSNSTNNPTGQPNNATGQKSNQKPIRRVSILQAGNISSNSFEQRLLDQEDYKPRNFMQLLPPREFSDHDPRIPSTFVQSYYTNVTEEDDEGDENGKGNNESNTKLGGNQNSERQLRDLDKQIYRILQESHDDSSPAEAGFGIGAAQTHQSRRHPLTQNVRNANMYNNNINPSFQMTEQQQMHQRTPAFENKSTPRRMSQHFKAEVFEDSDILSDIKLDQRHLVNTRKDISKANQTPPNVNNPNSNSLKYPNNTIHNNINGNMLSNNNNNEFLPFDRRKENSIRFTESTLNGANDFLGGAASAADQSFDSFEDMKIRSFQLATPPMQHRSLHRVDDDNISQSSSNNIPFFNQKQSQPIIYSDKPSRSSRNISPQPNYMQQQYQQQQQNQNQRTSISPSSLRNTINSNTTQKQQQQHQNSLANQNSEKKDTLGGRLLSEESEGAYQRQKDREYKNYIPVEDEQLLEVGGNLDNPIFSDSNFNGISLISSQVNQSPFNNNSNFTNNNNNIINQYNNHKGSFAAADSDSKPPFTSGAASVATTPNHQQQQQQPQLQQLSDGYNSQASRAASLKMSMKLDLKQVKQPFAENGESNSSNNYNNNNVTSQFSQQKKLYQGENQENSNSNLTSAFDRSSLLYTPNRQQQHPVVLTEEEERMYYELREKLVDSSKKNFSSISRDAKGVLTAGTRLSNGITQKSARKQPMQFESLGHASNFTSNSPLLFKIPSSTEHAHNPLTSSFISPKNFNRNLASSVSQSQQFSRSIHNKLQSASQMNILSPAAAAAAATIGKSPHTHFNRKSKGIMTILLDFEGEEIELEIFADDTAFTVAERACVILQKVITRDQIKVFASIIQNRVNDYTLSLEKYVAELQSAKLKEKEIVDRFIEERNIRESLYQQQEQSSTKNNEMIGKLVIELNSQTKKQAVIRIREKDDPYDLAFAFITTYNIKKNKINFIVNQITEIQLQHKQNKKFEFNATVASATPAVITLDPTAAVPSIIGTGLREPIFSVNIEKGKNQIIRVQIYEGDNLKQVAFQTMSDNQLNSDSYQKILRTLEQAYSNHLENEYKEQTNSNSNNYYNNNNNNSTN